MNRRTHQDPPRRKKPWWLRLRRPRAEPEPWDEQRHPNEPTAWDERRRPHEPEPWDEASR